MYVCRHYVRMCVCVLCVMNKEGRKCLFKDTLNTFYLRLYGVGHMVKNNSVCVRSWCDGASDRSFMVNPLSYFSFQPVLHDWCNKGHGTYHPVYGMMLIGKSSLCGSSGFSLPLSEWSFTICLLPHNRKTNVLSVSLNKTFPSFLPSFLPKTENSRDHTPFYYPICYNCLREIQIHLYCLPVYIWR